MIMVLETKTYEASSMIASVFCLEALSRNGAEVLCPSREEQSYGDE
jgi:hypothetical protein